MKKIARLWEKLDNNKVQCHVCANECTINEDKVGICRTRKNIDGELYTLIYGSMISQGSLDPIEKKPLYNFWPGHTAYSIASIGCSFRCLHCQNWSISQAIPDDDGKEGSYDFEDYKNRRMSLVEMNPKELTKKVVKSGAKTLAYTYNEPLIWHEWIIDTSKLLQKEGIKTILVTNGFSTPQATEELIEAGIDAANIDIKGITDEFYKKVCGVNSVKPVLDTAKRFKSNGIHVEITNLIIPDLNDSEKDIKKLCTWVMNNLGEGTPLHFSAYHPDYKMPSRERTPLKTLDNAYKIAKEVGLFFPYIGNARHHKGGNTYCPNCGEILIERQGYRFSKVQITEDKECGNCSYNIGELITGEINKKPSHRFNFF
ncbi:MAG: AmmeMemoRadiSam system radical SAM enzyme [Candidatus Lokiarchaeota archaeon]|nr:AmmeMemoRadiSam system radical SAM enzyme [Candidatus Lokiarchaeota archaeon]MBD3200857.1 AmmeMemoRadiSam system radical SAM enzyme [Candidatus Lokiarchaeota archaeon]